MRTTSNGSGRATVVLIFAIITTGLTAGVFVEWSSTIMPGLAPLDDRSFVLTFRSLDAAINNPLFLGVEFSGALLLIAAAAALYLRAERRRALPWIVAALLTYLAAVMITFAVNEPLNTRLRMISDSPDFAALRAELNAARWTAWNTGRAVTSTIAFGCLVIGLTRRRRSPVEQPEPVGSARLGAPL